MHVQGHLRVVCTHPSSRGFSHDRCAAIVSESGAGYSTLGIRNKRANGTRIISDQSARLLAVDQFTDNMIRGSNQAIGSLFLVGLRTPRTGHVGTIRKTDKSIVR